MVLCVIYSCMVYQFTLLTSMLSLFLLQRDVTYDEAKQLADENGKL